MTRITDSLNTCSATNLQSTNQIVKRGFFRFRDSKNLESLRMSALPCPGKNHMTSEADIKVQLMKGVYQDSMAKK